MQITPEESVRARGYFDSRFKDYNAWPIIQNNIITNCPDGEGIYISYVGGERDVMYNDVWNNADGNFAGHISPDPSNLSANPMYVDPVFNDFHLQEGSPCIDAGDPDSAPDPDGTVADMGVFFYAQEAVGETTDPDHPDQYSLGPSYPNPFNPTTTLSFSLAKASHVTLRVFDLLGREVALLVDDYRYPNTYEVVWDAQDVPSGVYISRLEASDFAQTQKMVLMK